MTGSRTAFFSATVLGSALWLLPVAAHAGDVTVDYSQLETRDNADVVPLFTPQLTHTEVSNLKAPIHLHPLTAAITSPTVKNLAAEALKPEIHLHPPAPKALAATLPTQPVVDPAQPAAAPITNIDLALAAVPAVPPAPKPSEATAAPSVVEPPKVAEVTPKAVDAIAAAPTDVPQPNVDITLDKAAIPVKPKEEVVPPPAETNLADAAPTAPMPPEPKKSPDDNAPSGFVRVNAVAGKTDDLTPSDVVGLDFGPPEKTVDN